MKKVLFVLLSFLFYLFISCEPNSVSEENDSVLLRIQIGEKYGYMNEKGRIVIEPQFDEGNLTFSEGVCFARLGNKRGLIDKAGCFIIELPDSVAYVEPFIDGYACAQLSRLCYKKITTGYTIGYYPYIIIDRNGNCLLKEALHGINGISINKDENNIYLCVGGGYNSQDWIMETLDGDTIGFPCDSILLGFQQGMCAVKHNGKWGYMNKLGEIKIDTIFDFARAFSSDGLARVRKDSLEFFIDANGNKLFSVDKALTGFDCNRAAVELGGKKCLINSIGEIVCEVDAEKVYSFNENDGLATIIQNGKAAKIDTLGNMIISTNYDNIGHFVNGVAIVVKNRKYGVVDLTGKEIISPSYDMRGQLTYNEYGISADYSIICLANKIGDNNDDNNTEFFYFDLQGNLIGKDMPMLRFSLPSEPTKEDFVKYFDNRLSEMDPIEGIYYVTANDYYQSRENPNIMGLNNSESWFWAIINRYGEYWAFPIDGTGRKWVNKFVKIGESNNYAITKRTDNDYSSEGKMTLEDPYKFGFRLEQGHNDGYNFFVTYELEKDYPPVSEYEKIKRVDWTGSGFAIADGYIATNYHVTSGAKTIRIRGVNGNMDEVYKGIVVAYDKEHDLSIIKIADKDFESFGSIPYSIGKTSVDVGDDVFVLGYPIVETMGKEVKLTEGVISSSTGYKGNSAMYQISAAVQPGNSGGPLFNEEGVVIGVVCAKHTDAENANYAIKISYLYSLINSSNLGVKVSDNSVREKKRSNIVKRVKDYVYLIECSSL